jgi:hypothetical protein
LAVRAWSTTQVGGAMMLRTSWEVNQNGLGCIASERLSFTRLGKAFRGKPRSKPESGNPTFRDCRGARGNVTLSVITWCARLGSIPTPVTVEQTDRKRVLPFTGRLVDAKRTQQEAGREDSAPKTRRVAMPTPLTRRKAALGRPIMRGRTGVAGVPSSGHASKGISQEPRRAPPSPPHHGRY